MAWLKRGWFRLGPSTHTPLPPADATLQPEANSSMCTAAVAWSCCPCRHVTSLQPPDTNAAPSPRCVAAANTIGAGSAGSVCDSGGRRSHRGHFTLVNLDEAGAKRQIMTGFDLDTADAAELSLYEQGKQRHLFFALHDDVVDIA